MPNKTVPLSVVDNFQAPVTISELRIKRWAKISTDTWRAGIELRLNTLNIMILPVSPQVIDTLRMPTIGSLKCKEIIWPSRSSTGQPSSLQRRSTTLVDPFRPFVFVGAAPPKKPFTMSVNTPMIHLLHMTGRPWNKTQSHSDRG